VSTHILDQIKYGRLLAEARPHVISNDDDLERFTQIVLELDELEHPSGEQRELAELLTTLIEQYEAEHYSLPKATPTELICSSWIASSTASPFEVWSACLAVRASPGQTQKGSPRVPQCRNLSQRRGVRDDPACCCRS
jgi:hypothetical protein